MCFPVPVLCLYCVVWDFWWRVGFRVFGDGGVFVLPGKWILVSSVYVVLLFVNVFVFTLLCYICIIMFRSCMLYYFFEIFCNFWGVVLVKFILYDYIPQELVIQIS